MKNLKKAAALMLCVLLMMQLAAPLASAVKISGGVVLKAGDKGYSETTNTPFSDSSHFRRKWHRLQNLRPAMSRSDRMHSLLPK